jgi:Ala-tRNA(Pro) deacylase
MQVRCIMNEESPSAQKSPEALFARLAALGIETETHWHEPVFTVEEARAKRGALPGVHCKCLFLRDKKGAHWLVVAEESLRVDLKALARRLGADRFSFASAERLVQHLGVEPGSVTPFALINDASGAVRVALDAAMLAGGALHYHPLTNRATTRIAAPDLVRFIEACGHRPEIVDFDALAAGA